MVSGGVPASSQMLLPQEVVTIGAVQVMTAFAHVPTTEAGLVPAAQNPTRVPLTIIVSGGVVHVADETQDPHAMTAASVQGTIGAGATVTVAYVVADGA